MATIRLEHRAGHVGELQAGVPGRVHTDQRKEEDLNLHFPDALAHRDCLPWDTTHSVVPVRAVLPDSVYDDDAL